MSKSKNRKRISLGHKIYGRTQIKRGIKEIGETTIDQYIGGIVGYSRAIYKIINGINHIKKSKKIYHR
jgi:hypothetical protein